MASDKIVQWMNSFEDFYLLTIKGIIQVANNVKPIQGDHNSHKIFQVTDRFNVCFLFFKIPLKLYDRIIDSCCLLQKGKWSSEEE